MPSPSTSPTSILKDAVASFLQSANHAVCRDRMLDVCALIHRYVQIAVAEETHRDAVTRTLETERDLLHQIAELRHERDDALQEKFKAALEVERAKCEADGWKAAVSISVVVKLDCS